MSATMHVDAAMFDAREEPGVAASAALAAAVHVVLALLLLFGVSWQNRAPTPVMVELWEPPPAVREAPPPAPVKVAPEQPPPPPVVKPEIVERAKPVPKPPPKIVPKPAPKVEAKAPAKPAPPREDLVRKRMLDEASREQMAMNVQRERDRVKDLLAREMAGANQRGLATWTDKVTARVRANVLIPPGVSGNPQAVFHIVQNPNGVVLDVRLKKSSGHRALDEAIERAILKSSPLPKPDKQELYVREFDLSYRPNEL